MDKLQSLPEGQVIHVEWVYDYSRYEGEEAMILENAFALHKLVVAMINDPIEQCYDKCSRCLEIHYGKYTKAAKALIYE